MPRWLRLSPTTLFYLAVALFASAPAWIVRHPPLQDLPIHLATMRIIRSFGDPAYGFDHDFVMTLGRTQYVVYYLIGALFSFLTGVVAADVVLVSVYLGGTVLGLRALLKALGKDERLCILVIPLLVNMMFIYGLFPFLLGIPLMLFALATSVHHFERPTRKTGVTLCVLTLALFYSHIFPFAIFAIGFAALFPWGNPSRWGRALAPLLPAAGFTTWWLFFTEAGRLVLGAATDNAADPRKSPEAAIVDLPNWFTNVFRDNSDEVVVIALAALVVLILGLSQGDIDSSKPVSRRYVLLPVACIVLYFLLPEGHGYIWLIAQRFPILFAILAIPLLRMPRGARGMLVVHRRARARGRVGHEHLQALHRLREARGRRHRRRDRRDGAAQQGVRADLRPRLADHEQPALPPLRLVLPGGERGSRRVHVCRVRALAGRLPAGPLPPSR